MTQQPRTTTPATTESPDLKFQRAVKPVLEEVIRPELAKLDPKFVKIELLMQDVLVEQNRMRAELEILSKNIAEKKKAPATKTRAPPADGSAGTADTMPAGGVVKGFASNKLIYFRNRYKADPEWRARFATPEIQAKMDADPSITSRTSEEQRLTAQATYCWNYMKQNGMDAQMTEVEKEFADAKKAFEEGLKPAVQVAEPAKTPESERVSK